VCGTSGSGKSTLTTGLLERLGEASYQFAIVDPEGDYASLELAAVLGSQQREPLVGEVIDVVREPSHNVVANLLGVAASQRPECFARLLAALAELRVRTGRPHWLVVDEAHHLLPAHGGHTPQRLSECVFVTVHPDRLAPSVLASIDIVIAVGASPKRTLMEFAAARGQPLAELPQKRHKDHVACWFVRSDEAPFTMRVIPGQAERIRHHRKYAEGDVRYHSFYFRGPENKHNLKAQNLNVFCQIAEGIGEDTWMFHLRRHDYSRWMRDVIRNRDLAAAVEDIERRADLTPSQTRALVCAAVEARYTLPE